MSFDEHAPAGCWTCGSVCDPCQCSCDHAWKNSCCIYCAKQCDCAEFEDGECKVCGWECEHAEIEDFYCVACGEYRLEDMIAAAYDYAKGARYDD